MVEYLVEAAVDETDTHGTDYRAAAVEYADRAHHVECERDRRRVQRDDVQGESVVHEVHGEYVVREHHSELVCDAERLGKVLGRLDDQQIDDRAEPQRQIGGVAVAAQPADREHQGHHRAADHQ